MRPLLCASTGAGKTAIADYIISSAVAKGGKVLFLAARRELVHQANKRVIAPHGLILSGSDRHEPDAPVQVASIQTMLNRDIPFTPSVVVLDECHHSTAKTHQELLQRFPDSHVIGMTATPVRATGMGLGDYFTSIVQTIGTADLIEQGYLVPLQHLVGPRKDGPSKTLFADPIAMWLAHAKDTPTMAFCASVEESIKLADKFNAIGVPAIHCDGTTDSDIRDKLSERMESGEIKVACNFGLWAEGVDMPFIRTVIFDRKTSSLIVYLQAAGRGLRPSAGKDSLLFLDHGGNLYTHGRIDQNRQWVLTQGRDVLKGQSTPDVADDIHVCPKCYTVAPPGVMICACGYKFFAKKKKTYRHIPGTLQLAHDDGSVTTIADDKLRKDYERFLWQQRNGRKKDGTPFSPRFAWFKFKQMYGFPPRAEWG